jgi:hypothetical protein
MRVINQYNETITKYDLTKGRLVNGKIKHKDGTVEKVQIYVPNKSAPNPIVSNKTKIKRLKEQLSATDYKVIKCCECYFTGRELPYDTEELHLERQAIRDEINRLEEQL